MFFKRQDIPILSTPPAFVRQLTDEEMQRYNIGINGVSATINIIYFNKEDTLMVEKLKIYLAELNAKKEEILNKDNTAEIEAEVSAYRDSLVKSIEAERAAAVAKVDSDIDCVSVLISRESEAIEKEAEEVVSAVVENPVIE